jgi:hypothetical protein
MSCALRVSRTRRQWSARETGAGLGGRQADAPDVLRTVEAVPAASEIRPFVQI